jgi:PAS domain S-box-containing protein
MIKQVKTLIYRIFKYLRVCLKIGIITFGSVQRLRKTSMENQPSTTSSYINALLPAQAAFELILNNLEETFLLVDQELRIVLANEATKAKAKKYFGIEINAGISILELAHPHRHDYLRAVYDRVFRGATENTETEIEVRGTRLFLESFYKPARDREGKVIGALVSTRDITEKKRLDAEQQKAKEDLRLSEQQYKTLFDHNPLPCWIYEAQSSRFLQVNEAAIRHYGYSREDFLQMSLWDIQADYREESTKANIEHARNRRTFALNNTQHRISDGRTIFVDLRITAIHYRGRDARLVVAQDVTSRVVTENELRKSNERFTLVARTASEALWEYDFVSEEAFISSIYTDIFGWHADEFRKFDQWSDYIHPDDKEETIRGYEQTLQDPHKEKWEKEYRYRKADGSYAFVYDKAVILRDEKGAPVKVVGALQDVTGQKKIEEELRRSNERFLFASRAASDAIYEWDLQLNEVYWGEGLQTLFGLQPADITITDWEERLHPHYRERVLKTLNDALAHPRKKFWKVEYLFCKSDGSYSYVLDRGFIIRDSEGRPTRMIGSMQDISDRREHERLVSLERSIFESAANLNLGLKEVVESLLTGLEEFYPDALTSVLLLRDDQTVQHLAAPRLPADYVAGINGLKIGPEVGSCGSAMFHKKNVIVTDIETNPLWKDYKEFAARFGLKACWSLPILHASGKVIGSFAIYHKKQHEPNPKQLHTVERLRNILQIIMENRLSLQEIKEVNERFDIMMKATHDLIWDWNLLTNAIYRDPVGLRKVYGVDNNEAIQTIFQWLHRIHPEDVSRVEKVINNILTSHHQNHFDVEYRFRRNDGVYTHVYDRGIILRDEEGKPCRMIGAAQDISVRKRLEKELLDHELDYQKAINQATVDTQERERAEIGKELHDNVNQVLTTTKLYLDLALSNPELKDELIQKSTKNILSVINEIRQLSRSLMNPSIGDLGLMDSIHDLIENINLTRKLHVSLLADASIEESLSQNQKLTVFRIIQEALNNAIKHARASTVTIRFLANGGSAKLVIEDDGVGFNIHSVKKGAGLKNIQNRVYLIDGEHTIESTPESGSRLLIEFPLHLLKTIHSV